MGDANGHGFRVGFRIINGHLYVQVAEVPTPQPFCQAQRFTARVPDGVQRTLVVKAYCFGDECITFPFPNGITKLARLRIGRKLTAVCEDLTENRVGLVQEQRHAGRLNNLVRNRNDVRQGQGRRRAKRGRLLLTLRQARLRFPRKALRKPMNCGIAPLTARSFLSLPLTKHESPETWKKRYRLASYGHKLIRARKRRAEVWAHSCTLLSANTKRELR